METPLLGFFLFSGHAVISSCDDEFEPFSEGRISGLKATKAPHAGVTLPRISRDDGRRLFIRVSFFSIPKLNSK